MYLTMTGINHPVQMSIYATEMPVFEKGREGL